MEWAAVLAKKGGGGEDRKNYEWEEKRNDDLWIMETLGNRMLHKVGPGAGAKAPDAQGQAPAVVWRQHCCAEGFDPGCHCLCKRFDPVIMLPSSLFSELEVGKDVHRAAMQLLTDAEGTIPGGLEKRDLELDVQEHVCHLTESRCQTVCFRVRQRTRHLYIEGARSRAAERDMQGVEGDAAALRLDRFEFEANMYLLRELLGWCNECRAVKGHKVSQLRQTARQKQVRDAEAHLRRTDIEHKLRRFSMTDLPNTPGEVPGLLALPAPPEEGEVTALVPRPGTAASAASQGTLRSSYSCSSLGAGRATGTPQVSLPPASRGGSRPSSRGSLKGPDMPGKAILCCRCGHSAVWHDAGAENKEVAYVAPWLQVGKHGRSMSVAYQTYTAVPGKNCVVAGGVLSKAGASLFPG